jgi:hypothetical protein
MAVPEMRRPLPQDLWQSHTPNSCRTDTVHRVASTQSLLVSSIPPPKLSQYAHYFNQGRVVGLQQASPRPLLMLLLASGDKHKCQ